MKRWYGSMEEELRKFEQEEFGTNDMEGIKKVIREQDWEERQQALTGMEEEQADWESDEMD